MNAVDFFSYMPTNEVNVHSTQAGEYTVHSPVCMLARGMWITLLFNGQYFHKQIYIGNYEEVL